jgi:hypothetical protein
MLTAGGALLATSAPLSQDVQSAVKPEIGIDDAGNAIVSWDVGAATYLRVRRPTGTFSAATSVSPSTDFASEPRLVVDADGRAFATWLVDGTLLRGRARTAAGTLSAPVTLSGVSGELDPAHALALDADGNALVAWSKTLSGERRVQARTRTPTGKLGAIATLSPAGADATGVEAAISRTGGVGVIAWIRPDGGGIDRAQQRRLSGGAWAPVETMSPEVMPVSRIRLGLSQDGSQATTVFDGYVFGFLVRRLLARTRGPSGVYGPAALVSHRDNNSSAAELELATNGAGRTVAAWTQADNGNPVIWTGASFIPDPD